MRTKRDFAAIARMSGFPINQSPLRFLLLPSLDDGVKEVVGCIWEMNIVQFELEAWATQLLDGRKSTEDGLREYLQQDAAPEAKN